MWTAGLNALPPADTCVTPVSPVTWTGVFRLVRDHSPLPSWELVCC